MAHVAALGFPAPAVYSAAGPDLVMERLHGPSLLTAMSAQGHDPVDGAGILARLHTRLHTLRPPPGTGDERVLHLDLHPDNVVLTDRGPVLIDWTNATVGPPDLDVALSGLILAEVAVDPDHEHTALATVMLPAFLDEAHGQPLRMLDRALARRAADPTLSEPERSRLEAAAALVTAAAR
jgi:aminoglycoside phosphotransferase (APT) family kinase protein